MMNRAVEVHTKALTNVLGTTPVITMAGMAGGIVLVPASYVSVTITPYVCDTEDGTYLALYTPGGDAVTMTVAASRAVSLPTTVYGAKFLKLVTNADDSSRPVTLILKG